MYAAAGSGDQGIPGSPGTRGSTPLGELLDGDRKCCMRPGRSQKRGSTVCGPASFANSKTYRGRSGAGTGRG
jgi:hypothetical protein